MMRTVMIAEFAKAPAAAAAEPKSAIAAAAPLEVARGAALKADTPKGGAGVDKENGGASGASTVLRRLGLLPAALALSNSENVQLHASGSLAEGNLKLDLHLLKSERRQQHDLDGVRGAHHGAHA